MKSALPTIFILLASGALLIAVSFMWASLRTLFGGESGLWVEESAAMRKRAELLDEKDAVLRSLKDLEFEREVGKLSPEDFKRLDAEFRARAKLILQQLDEDLRVYRDKAERLIAAEVAKPSGAKESA